MDQKLEKEKKILKPDYEIFRSQRRNHAGTFNLLKSFFLFLFFSFSLFGGEAQKNVHNTTTSTE